MKRKRILSAVLAGLLAVSVTVPAAALEEPAPPEEPVAAMPAPPEPSGALPMPEPDAPPAPPEGEPVPISLDPIVQGDLATTSEAPADNLNISKQLSEVTLKVKNTLGIDSNEYEDFSGELSQEVFGNRWNLNWFGEGDEVSVSAGDDGKIYRYNRYTDSYYYGGWYGFDAKLSVDVESARREAEAFLNRVVTADGESWEMSEDVSSWDNSVSFSGNIFFNGIKSPVSFNVRTEDGEVRYFSRSDNYGGYVGETPAAESSTTASAAMDQLAGTVKLEPVYVSDGDGSAVLMYVPEYSNYAVMADGSLVDVDEVYNDLWDRIYGGMGAGDSGAAYAMEAPAAESSALTYDAASLSSYEVLGVSEYEDVLSDSELDAMMRADKNLGLEGFELGGISYTRDMDGSIFANANYGKPVEYNEGDRGFISRSITLDAKTGELTGIWTSYPYGYEVDEKLDREDLEPIALELLEKYFPEEFAGCEQGEEEYDPDFVGDFNFTRVENGYKYRNNYVYITLSTADGSVDSLGSNWDDDIVFDSAEGIISAEEALEAYLDVFEAEFMYITWPVMVSPEDPLYAKYAANYYDYVEELRPAYQLTSELQENGWIEGVDAKTGEVVSEKYSEDTAREYTDIAGSYAEKEISVLAAEGITAVYEGPEFGPELFVTWREALNLLLTAAEEYWYESEDEDLLVRARGYGLVAGADPDLDAEISRLEFVREIIGASQYGCIAELDMVFSCSYADADQLSDEDYGYVAVCEALGMAQGNEKDEFEPFEPLNRQDAAVMIYNFMTR